MSVPLIQTILICTVHTATQTTVKQLKRSIVAAEALPEQAVNTLELYDSTNNPLGQSEQSLSKCGVAHESTITAVNPFLFSKLASFLTCDLFFFTKSWPLSAKVEVSVCIIDLVFFSYIFISCVALYGKHSTESSSIQGNS